MPSISAGPSITQLRLVSLSVIPVSEETEGSSFGSAVRCRLVGWQAERGGAYSFPSSASRARRAAIRAFVRSLEPVILLWIGAAKLTTIGVLSTE